MGLSDHQGKRILQKIVIQPQNYTGILIPYENIQAIGIHIENWIPIGIWANFQLQ